MQDYDNAVDTGKAVIVLHNYALQNCNQRRYMDTSSIIQEDSEGNLSSASWDQEVLHSLDPMDWLCELTVYASFETTLTNETCMEIVFALFYQKNAFVYSWNKNIRLFFKLIYANPSIFLFYNCRFSTDRVKKSQSMLMIIVNISKVLP